MNLIKSKKQMFLVISIFTLLLFVGGTTYAFFNYTRTGGENLITTGRISFNALQGTTINLQNVFPISSTEAQTDTTNAKTLAITVTGDTDYTGGLEYVVTASDVNLTVGSGANAKTLPIAIEVEVANNGTGSLGTEETGDYYANRNSYTVSKYKVEYDGNLQDDSHILVGYIAPNTEAGTIEGINGIINIKAYLDASKIVISDTYNDGNTPTDEKGTPISFGEGKNVFTTSEWNAIQGQTALSFKVKVESRQGIWVPAPVTKITPVIEASADDITYYSDNLYIEVSKPTDISGTIYANIDGVVYNPTQDQNGTALFIIPELNAGVYDCIIVFTPSDTEQYNSATTTLSVEVEPFPILADDIKVTDYGDGTVVVSAGEELNGEIVEITTEGQTFTGEIVDGAASIELTGLSSGEHVIEVNIIITNPNYVLEEATTARVTI